MSVALAQPIIYGSTSTVTSIGLTLGSTPTVGNLLIFGYQGSYTYTKPTNMMLLATKNTGPYGQVLYGRVVQSGDTTGPYTITGLGTGYPGFAFIAELSGASKLLLDVIYNSALGTAAWTAAAYTCGSPNTINTVNGGLTLSWFAVQTTAVDTVGSDTVNQSFTVAHSAVQSGTSENGYACLCTRSETSISTAGPTATLPNITNATASTQNALLFCIPPSEGVSPFSFVDSGSNYVISGVMGAVPWSQGTLNGSGPASGQLMIAATFCNTNVAPTAPTTNSVTWSTLINGTGSGSNYAGWAIFYKWSTGSEPTSVTIGLTGAPSDHQVTFLLAISGTLSGQMPQFVNATGTSSPSATGSLTPAQMNMLGIAIFGVSQNVTAYSLNSGWGQLGFIGDGSASQCSCAMQYLIGVTNSTITPINTSTNTTGTVLAINNGLILLQSTSFLQTLTGTLSSSGNIKRRALMKVAAATLSSSGHTARQAALKVASATFSSSGKVNLAGRIPFHATLTSSGTIYRFVKMKLPSATFYPTAAIIRFVKMKLPSATLSSSGHTYRQAKPLVAGHLTNTGTVQLNAFAVLSGHLLNTGAVIRKGVVKVAGATLTSSGSVVGRIAFAAILSATLHPTATIRRLMSARVAGSLNSTGTTHRLATVRVAGTLLNTGSIIRKVTFKVASATLSSSGSVRLLLGMILHATLSSSGTIHKLGGLRVGGTLLSSGYLKRRAIPVLPASVIFSGSIKRFGTLKLPIAGLRPTANVLMNAFARLNGTLPTTGHTYRTGGAKVGGSLSSSGHLGRRAIPVFSATNQLSGSVKRRGVQMLIAFLPNTGYLRRQVSIVLKPTLSYSGKILRAVVAKPMSATLSSSGSIKGRPGVLLQGTWQASGKVLKKAGAVFQGTFPPTANVFRRVTLVPFHATLSSVGHTARQANMNLPAAHVSFSGRVSELSGIVFRATLATVGVVRRKGLARIIAFLNNTGFFYIPYPRAPVFTGTILVDRTYNATVYVDDSV